MAKMLMFVAVLAVLYGQTMAGGPPEITTTSATVPENSPNDTDVVTIMTQNLANVMVMIVSQTPSSDPMKFKIMTGTTKVVVNDMLDFEMTMSYVLLIRAMDSMDNMTMVEKNITVTVTNVNEAPMFSMSMYTASVPDGFTQSDGNVSALLSVTDPENDTITISITDASNTNMDFAVVSNRIQVAPNKALNRTMTPSYTLIVLATDDATPPLTGSATVMVTVTETNSGVMATAGFVSILVSFIYFLLLKN